MSIKHIVSFSGGMGSFAEAKAVCDTYGVENTRLLFADTMMEDEDLYRFMKETVAFLGCELQTVADGRTPFQVFKDVKMMGNSRLDPCSRILKRQLLIKTMQDEFQPHEVEVHLGIDYSEQHRLVTVQNNMKPYVYRSLLVENGVIIPKNYSERYGIKPPRLYSWGLGHNNCGGFCVKAGLGHYKALYIANKERYLQFEQEEQAVYDSVGKTFPFIVKTVGGVKNYITLRQYRETYLETDSVTQAESQEFGGCGCAI
jgi:hypothetical protein